MSINSRWTAGAPVKPVTEITSTSLSNCFLIFSVKSLSARLVSVIRETSGFVVSATQRLRML